MKKKKRRKQRKYVNWGAMGFKNGKCFISFEVLKAMAMRLITAKFDRVYFNENSDAVSVDDVEIGLRRELDYIQRTRRDLTQC